MSSAIYYLPVNSTLNAKAIGKAIEKFIVVTSGTVTVYGNNVRETADAGTTWTVDSANGTAIVFGTTGTGTPISVDGLFEKIATSGTATAIAYLK